MPSTRTVSLQQWRFRAGLSDLLALSWKMSLKSCRSEMRVKLWDVQAPPGGRLQRRVAVYRHRRNVTSDLTFL